MHGSFIRVKWVVIISCDEERKMKIFWFRIFAFFSDNKKYLEDDKSLMISFIFKNGAFTIDSWFFISGALLTQFFFKSSKDFCISNHKKIFHHFEHVIFLYFYKVVQILLPLFVCSKILLVAMKHFDENSILNVPSNDHFTCEGSVFRMLFNIYLPHSQWVS
jgi:hypothetical protein